jgi:hypothetical protein
MVLSDQEFIGEMRVLEKPEIMSRGADRNGRYFAVTGPREK